MLFKKYNIYENKLSEQVSNDNPIKKKLIDMETPTDKHPIYSFLTIGLLIYVWLFLGAMIYKQAYGYILASVVVVFTMIGIFMTYKKEYIVGLNSQYRRNMNIMLTIAIILSFIISFYDKGDLPWKSIGNVFIFFVDVNDKSYIALSILAFICLGISLSYASCQYYLYRAFYSVNETYKSYENVNTLIIRNFDLCVLFALVFIPFISYAFNPAKDSFQFMLKNFSLTFYFIGIPIFISVFRAKKYNNISKKHKINLLKEK